ncbi:MAG: 3'-5' exonuclease [bacterium]|nr:3'-5' exonuclease [bacterium]
MLKSAKPYRTVVFDLETTGLSPFRGDRIIEIGAIIVEGGSIVREYHSLIDAGRPVSIHAFKVNGINREMLAHAPKPETVMPEFKDFISDSVLVAHNAKFDIGFLRYEFSRQGIAFSNRHHCTLTDARRLYPKLQNHRLETVYRHLFGALPDKVNMHRALDDARMTARVWMEIEAFKSSTPC